jgi:carbon-monoxide dehydrogenase medium subunit
MTRVGSDISKITCAVALDRQDETCGSCKIAMGAVAPTPIRITAAEKMLNNSVVNDEIIEEAARQVASSIIPQTDVRSTEEYRRQVSTTLFKETFNRAWEQAGGKK